MGSEKIELLASKREVTGKKVQALRRAGQIPATVYEKGKDSLNIQLEYMPLNKVWQKAGKHHTIELSIDGKKQLTMIKDISRDPAKGLLTHVSFHAIKQNEAIEAEIPIHLVGQSPAQIAGLNVRLNVDTVFVKGLPANMPDSIEIDISGVVTEDDDIRGASLNIPADVTAVDLDPDQVIVSVTVPRAEVEKVAEEEVAAADVPSDQGGEKPAEE